MPAATQVEVLLKWDGGNGKGTKAEEEDGKKKDEKGADKKDESPKPKADANAFKKIGGGINKFVKGQLGLNFGISALVKQSQIFTSTVGVIFQLLGALVDVMLAPLIPLFLPLIRMLGNAIPFVQRNIVPMIESIVAWLLGFLGSWDGSWSMLKEELLGLGEKFTKWWDSTASPWLKEKLVDVQEWIGDKLQEFLDWFKEAGPRVQGWVTTLFITQTAKVTGWLLRLPMFLLKLLFKLPGMLTNMVGLLTKMMFPIIGDAMVWIITKLWGIVTWLKDKILKLGGTIISGIYKGALDLVKMILKGLGSALGKIPMIGGKLQKMTGNIVDLVEAAKNPKVLAKTIGGKLAPLAKMSKAIPVLGSVATLGFGAWEVAQSIKSGDYEKALFLTTKTVAATALTAFGHSMAGLAVDMGGTMAAGALFKSNNDIAAATAVNGVVAGPAFHPGNAQSTTVEVHINNFDGEGSKQEQAVQNLKVKDGEMAELSNALWNEG